MKITISEIPEEGLDLTSEEKIELEGLRLRSPAKFSLRVEKSGAEVVVRGSVRADIELTCGRCLKDFVSAIEVPLEVVYRPSSEFGDLGEHGGGEKRELKTEELETGFYEGDELDIDELFREQLLLGIPMKTLCSDACKGICPSCGADLNEGGCLCGAKGPDPRLEKLKEYFERRKE